MRRVAVVLVASAALVTALCLPGAAQTGGPDTATETPTGESTQDPTQDPTEDPSPDPTEDPSPDPTPSQPPGPPGESEPPGSGGGGSGGGPGGGSGATGGSTGGGGSSSPDYPELLTEPPNRDAPAFDGADSGGDLDGGSGNTSAESTGVAGGGTRGPGNDSGGGRDPDGAGDVGGDLLEEAGADGAAGSSFAGSEAWQIPMGFFLLVVLVGMVGIGAIALHVNSYRLSGLLERNRGSGGGNSGAPSGTQAVAEAVRRVRDVPFFVQALRHRAGRDPDGAVRAPRSPGADETSTVSQQHGRARSARPARRLQNMLSLPEPLRRIREIPLVPQALRGRTRRIGRRIRRSVSWWLQDRRYWMRRRSSRWSGWVDDLRYGLARLYRAVRRRLPL